MARPRQTEDHMSYPEGLRNYQGPWPPPKDFLLSDNEIAFRSERRSWKGGLLFKTFVVSALVAIILPNVNIHQIPVLRALFHVLGRVFPMIQGVGYYSHESLADVAGASILNGVSLASIAFSYHYRCSRVDACSYAHDSGMGRLACIRDNTAARKEIETDVIGDICTGPMLCRGDRLKSPN